LTYVSSSMLGKLISLNKEVKAKGGKLALCQLTPTVQEIFALMKLNEVLDVRQTEADGFKAFE
jgi:anti-sigma B factor antagonist